MSDSTLFLYHLRPYGWVWITRRALGLKDVESLPYDYPPKEGQPPAKQTDGLPEKMSRKDDEQGVSDSLV